MESCSIVLESHPIFSVFDEAVTFVVTKEDAEASFLQVRMDWLRCPGFIYCVISYIVSREGVSKGEGCLAGIIGFASPLLQQHMLPPASSLFY